MDRLTSFCNASCQVIFNFFNDTLLFFCKILHFIIRALEVKKNQNERNKNIIKTFILLISRSIILCSEIFSSICLIENNYSCWFKIFSLKCSSCCDTKSKWKIIKVIDTDRCILRYILSHSCNMSFDNVITI
jgi:hypothetical protein